MWRWEVIDRFVKERGFTSGAELGVKEGRFISYLLKNNPDLFMVGVDLWEACPNELEDYATWNFSRIHKMAKDACAPYGVRCDLIKKDTVKAADIFKKQKEKFDFIFIDADHSTNGVLRDYMAWLPLVRKGGIIFGHDVNWPSVQEALHMLGVDYEVHADNVWSVENV